jgi:microcystin-dependent protein
MQIEVNGGQITSAGGNQPLPIMQPYLGMNYCIALQGIYPPRD